MAAPRVLVGQIWKETHQFNPMKTTAADFAVEAGEALIAVHRTTGSILGGIIRTLEAAGAVPVPTLAARARPGGPVEHAIYAGFKASILEVARRERPDAVALELHGAMATDEIDDPEGDLLAALRAVVGPHVPIGVGLDLHTNVTEAMLEASDILTACKENPHSDLLETGEATARMVLDTLAGRLRPVTAAVRLPLLATGQNETSSGPLAMLHARARALRERLPSLVDVSICNGFPFADHAGVGQRIVAIADADEAAARAAVEDIATAMWEVRARFVDEFPGIDAVLDTILARRDEAPFVVSDDGDRVLAGTPGDSNAILARLLEREGGRPGGLRAVIPITDPVAAAAARAAGIGAEVTLRVGGAYSTMFPPLAVTGTVRHLSDGRFVMKGPYMGGQESSMGDTALVAVGPITLMLTSLAALTQDPAAFTSQGIRIEDQDFVVVKSGNHFKLSFAGIATPLIAGTPGMGVYAPGTFPYVKARPFYPEDPVALATIAATVYPATAAQREPGRMSRA